LFSGLILIFVFFLPESPRWLFVNNKLDKAKDMLTKYHGEGNPDSIWVQMKLKEYDEVLELDGADKMITVLCSRTGLRDTVLCATVLSPSSVNSQATNCTYLQCIPSYA